MKVHLLGTRGSVPNPCKSNIEFGGNTQCVAILTETVCTLLDGGTGIFPVPRITKSKVFNILLSHYHLDHITGIPMFSPLFDESVTVRFFAPKYEGKEIEYWFNQIFSPPFWPITPHSFKANIEYHTVQANQTFQLEDEIEVSTVALNHPNGAMGYCVKKDEKRLCYLSDHEHTKEFDERISTFIFASDIVLADAPYTKEQYEQSKVGFGHSVGVEMAELAAKSNVKQLIITHHDGDNNDERLFELEKELQQTYPNYVFAKEEMVIHL